MLVSPADAPLLLTALREATRHEHAHIEALLQLQAPMPLSRYAAIMGGFSTFLGAWEARIAQALPAHLHGWYAPRRRAAWAAADLQQLQASPSARTAQAARHAVDALALNSAASGFGSLYVIEGSALGGQVIAPQLQRTLGLSATHGARYFHGHGEHTGAMWREFRLLATREVGEAATDIAAAGRSAAATFQALAQVMAQALSDAAQPARAPLLSSTCA